MKLFVKIFLHWVLSNNRGQSEPGSHGNEGAFHRSPELESQHQGQFNVIYIYIYIYIYI